MIQELYVVSAFCKAGKGGNKAGVVLDGSGLSVSQKMKIAEELGFSETAYRSASDVADFKLEYFTPVEEVPLCGHATIATFSLMYHLNMLEKSDYQIETKAGILRVHVDQEGLVMMEQNCPEFGETLPIELFDGCVDVDSIGQILPTQVVSTGLRDIMMPIISVDHLEKLAPDFEVMSDLSRQKDVVGVHAFALVDDIEVTAVCRNFAPLYGIDEESATGTSNCALACYLYKYFDKKTEYVFEQGYNLDAVSRIIVKIEADGDEICKVYVGGCGCLVSSGDGAYIHKIELDA